MKLHLLVLASLTAIVPSCEGQAPNTKVKNLQVSTTTVLNGTTTVNGTLNMPIVSGALGGTGVANTGKTLNLGGSYTLNGTSGSTLNIGTGGTLGSAALKNAAIGGNGVGDSGKVVQFAPDGRIVATEGYELYSGLFRTAILSGAVSSNVDLVLPVASGAIATEEYVTSQGYGTLNLDAGTHEWTGVGDSGKMVRFGPSGELISGSFMTLGSSTAHNFGGNSMELISEEGVAPFFAMYSLAGGFCMLRADNVGFDEYQVQLPNAAGTLATEERVAEIAYTGTILTQTALLDFPSTAAGAITEQTFAVEGAALGDVVCLGIPEVSLPASGGFFARVSSTDNVTIRFVNSHLTLARDPAQGTFKVKVLK